MIGKDILYEKKKEKKLKRNKTCVQTFFPNF